MANPDGDDPATPAPAPKLPTRVPFAGPHPGSVSLGRPPEPPPVLHRTTPINWHSGPDRADDAATTVKDQKRPPWVRIVAGAAAAVLVIAVGLWWSQRGHATEESPSVASPPALSVAPVEAPSVSVTTVDPPTATRVAAPPAPPSSSPPRPPRSPSIKASPAAKVNTAGRNLALDGVATASSIERRDWPAPNAVDGDLATRWSSGFSDPQWLRVDLGARWQLSEIKLRWENAHATAYRLDVSTDGTTWKPVYRTSDGRGGDVVVELARVPARYVRMYGTERSTSYGYSLLEFEVR